MRQKQDLKDNLREKVNKGFSVLTVIISVAFVGILALLVLYMALSNFNMKVSDRKGKDSFYTAERALEEIRTGLQEDVGDSMSRAYIKVLEDYNKESDSSDTVLDELRQEAFEKEFGRPLSPMELEIINGWLNDNIPLELIMGALKEATFNGVSNFRYIDKILFEWRKKGYKTMNDVSSNYIKSREERSNNQLFDYDWLDDNDK